MAEIPQFIQGLTQAFKEEFSLNGWKLTPLILSKQNTEKSYNSTSFSIYIPEIPLCLKIADSTDTLITFYNTRDQYLSLIREKTYFSYGMDIRNWEDLILPIVSGFSLFLEKYLEDAEKLQFYLLQGNNYGKYESVTGAPDVYASLTTKFFPLSWSERNYHDFIQSGGDVNFLPSVAWQVSCIQYIDRSGLRPKLILRNYLGSNYIPYNAYLRGTDTSFNENKIRQIEGLRKLINGAPNIINSKGKYQVTVYRFISERDIQLEGDIMTTSGFLSTTLDPTFVARTPEYGESYLNGQGEVNRSDRVILKIVIKIPISALYIPSYEHELLFDHGRKLKFIDKYDHLYTNSTTGEIYQQELDSRSVIGNYSLILDRSPVLPTWEFEMME